MEKGNTHFSPGLNIKTFGLVYLLLIGLYFTTWVDYLLFHTLSELFSIVIGFCLFIIAIHTRNYIRNNYLLFIGMAYFFIAFLDLLHTLSYKGMPIFTDYDYYANQLWIGARYLESITLVLACIALQRERKINFSLVFCSYAVVCTALILSIFVLKIFPECFVAGVGQTPFKKVSEYIICVILLMASLLLFSNRNRFNDEIYRILQLSLCFTVISELAFTVYISNYGLSNLVGHYFKIFSFFLIYLAVVKTGLEEPVKVFFHDLDKANTQLKKEVEYRKKAEQDKEKLIVELKKALGEVKTLQGIIPICSHCKSIRDDKGAWGKLEAYIEDKSEAQFSHGICEACMETLYGNEKWYRAIGSKTDGPVSSAAGLSADFGVPVCVHGAVGGTETSGKGKPSYPKR